MFYLQFWKINLDLIEFRVQWIVEEESWDENRTVFMMIAAGTNTRSDYSLKHAARSSRHFPKEDWHFTRSILHIISRDHSHVSGRIVVEKNKLRSLRRVLSTLRPQFSQWSPGSVVCGLCSIARGSVILQFCSMMYTNLQLSKSFCL